MAKLPICPHCGENVNKNQPFKKYQNHTYHQNCYKQMCEEIYNTGSNKKTANTINTPTPQQELYDYICQLFGVNELTGKINSQLKNMFSENNFTYSGVRKTLEYFYEIKDNKPDLNYGIGIVPFIYNEAKEFYIKKNRVAKESSKTPIQKKEKTVRTKTKPRKPKYLVDIDKL